MLTLDAEFVLPKTPRTIMACSGCVTCHNVLRRHGSQKSVCTATRKVPAHDLPCVVANMHELEVQPA